MFEFCAVLYSLAGIRGTKIFSSESSANRFINIMFNKYVDFDYLGKKHYKLRNGRFIKDWALVKPVPRLLEQ